MGRTADLPFRPVPGSYDHFRFPLNLSSATVTFQSKPLSSRGLCPSVPLVCLSLSVCVCVCPSTQLCVTCDTACIFKFVDTSLII